MPLLPERATAEHFQYPMLVALIIVHGMALFAPFTFSWPGLVSFLIMIFITGCLGITLCYHRLLSHRSFKTHKPIKALLMLCGTLSFQGEPTWWAAMHRLHHRESDQEMDPHSPKVSFLWAHMLWLLFIDPRLKDKDAVVSRYLPDLANDPWAKFLEKFFLPINLAALATLYAIGYWLGGHKIGFSMLIWGGFLRIVWVWHITWFVNSVTHMFGYRNYTTRDDSRNLWWVALLAFGEGWHNNHHATPSAAPAGHRWWEFDLTYCIIKLMQWTGLAWKVHPVVAPKPAMVQPLPPVQSQAQMGGK